MNPGAALVVGRLGVTPSLSAALVLTLCNARIVRRK